MPSFATSRRANANYIQKKTLIAKYGQQFKVKNHASSLAELQGDYLYMLRRQVVRKMEQ